MADRLTRTIRENYDKLAKEYALHLFDELQHKPFDREVLTRFAHHTKNRGAVCDLGCGPGHVTRFLTTFRPRYLASMCRHTWWPKHAGSIRDSIFAKATCWRSISHQAVWQASSPSMPLSTCLRNN